MDAPGATEAFASQPVVMTFRPPPMVAAPEAEVFAAMAAVMTMTSVLPEAVWR